MSPKKNSITQDHLQAENEALRSKVAELEQTLQVLREGAVDAIAIPHPQGSQIFTLQGADQVYRVLIEEMSDGALTLSMDGMVLYCNQRFAEMLGIPLSRIIGSKIAGWLPPDEREKFEALLRQAGENSQRAEITLPGVDGSSLVASVFADSLSLGGMQVIYLVVADLTEYKNREVMLQSALEEARQARLSLLDLFEEQKSTERKLRESEFELQRFLNNSPDTVYVLDLVEHTSRFLNREEFLGYSRAELESDHSIMGAVHPDDLAFLSEQWKQLSYLGPNQVLNTQYRVKNKSGDWEWVQQRNTVLTYSEDGKPQKVLNTLSIVTEKKQMEDALRENEAIFAAAFHTSPVALVISRRSDGVFLEFNEELERISGYTRAELQGQSVNSLGLLADPEYRQRLVSQDLPRNLEIQMRHKSGEWRWLTFSMSPIQIQGQDCYLSVIQDIHSRKLIEQSLRESEEKFAAAFHNSPVGIVVTDAEGRLMEVNQAFCDLHRYKRDEAIGKTVVQLGAITDEINQSIGALLVASGSGLEPREIDIRDSEGKLHNVLYSIVPIKINGIPHTVGMTLDMTDRKQAEKQKEKALEELELERSLLRQLIDNLPDLIFLKDRESRFLVANRATASFMGVDSPEQLVGRTDFDFYPESLAQQFRAAERQVMESGEGINGFERTQLDIHQNEHWLAATKLALHDTHGQIIGLVGIERDITLRRRAEDALRESEERFRKLIDFSPVAIITFDEDGNFELVNRKAVEFFGASSEQDLIGKPVLDRVHPNFHVLTKQRIAQANETDGPVPFVETVFLRLDGTSFDVLSGGVPLKFQGKHSYVVSFLDITDRRLAEQALRESETKFRALLYNSPMQSVIWKLIRNSQGLITDWEVADINPLGAASIGLGEDSAHGRRAIELFGEEVMTQYLELSRQIDVTGQPAQFETHFRSNNRTYWSTNFLLGNDLYANISMDITDLRAAQSEIESMALFPAESPNPVLRLTHAGKILYANTSSEVLLHEWQCGVGGHVPVFLKEQVADVLARQANKVFELPCGDLVYLATIAYRVQSEYVNLYLSDITELKLVEQALRESEDKFKYVFDYSVVGKSITLPSGEVNVNVAFSQMLGYSVQEMNGLKWQDITHPEDIEPSQVEIDKLLRGEKESSRFIKRYLHKSGSTIWADISTSLRRDEEGKVLYFMTSILDITDQKRAENALRESETKFAVAFHTSPLALAITRLSDGLFLEFNEELERISGYSRAELQGQSSVGLGMYSSPEVRQTLAAQGELQNLEIQLRNKSGEWRWLSINVSPIQIQGQDCRLTVIQDIHERKHNEEELHNRTLDLQIIHAVNEAANRGGGLQGMAEAFAEAAHTAFDCRSVAIHLLSKDGSHLELQGTTLPKQVIAQVEKWLGTSIDTQIRIPLEKSAYIRRLLKNQQGVILNEAGEIHEWLSQFVETNSLPEILRAPARKLIPQIAKLINIQSVLILPLVSGGKALGLLVINSKNVFNQTHMERMDFIGKQVTAAILRQQTEDILHESEEKYRSLMESLDNVVATVDQEGSFLYMNQVAANQLGQPVEALVGKTIHDLFPPAVADSQLEHIRQAIREDTVQTYEALSNIGGELRWFRTVIQPIHDANGKVTHALINSTDIHELKTLYQELQELNHTLEERVQERTTEIMQVNAELEHAMRIKDEFLASMSHELRTPLNGILGFSESLEMNVYGSLNEKQTKVIKLIGESGQHLLELINDILDLAKVETGNLELDLSYVSVADVCLASLQLTKGMSGKRQQIVQYTPLVEPILLYGDARRLKQVLVNLLSNAIKFTPEKGELGLEVHANPQDQQIQFVVWDKGIGIKPEYLSRLFKPFTQIDSRLSREYSGTGLGLSLVQKLVELHDGSVEVASVFGEGSRFTVTLPWQPLESDQTEQETSSSKTNFAEDPPVPLKMPLVAIADDNDLMLQLITDFLEPRNFRVAAMNNGKVLLEKISYLRPDIVLMDIQMPGMDGLEAIRRVRAHSDPRIASIPIIAITALAMPGDKERCFEAGANEFVSKPFNLINLIGVLQQLLDRGK